ncbi:unnamed protein product [Mytilus coruscus]|uniref:PHD-type domain-containing protein n=1 Tax=Mytilus coruscus TaxID=42192 RepID=A0A6J8C673_MYTCO|nr:unnamed protein product [Mytilus coruscus]
MPAFYVPASETPKKQHRLQQQYSIDERKLMSDILYEDLNSKRSTVKFDRDERRLIAEIARQKDLESKVFTILLNCGNFSKPHVFENVGNDLCLQNELSISVSSQLYYLQLHVSSFKRPIFKSSDRSRHVHLLLKLLLSNQVETNPGPNNLNESSYPCSICSREFTWNQDAIVCDNCDKWCHAGCVNISSSMYEKYGNTSALWKLQKQSGQIENLITSSKPDFLIGNETWLNKDVKSSEIFPSSLFEDVFRRDGNRECKEGGGVLIAIKKGIICQQIYCSKNVELIAAQIDITDSKSLIIVSVYRPPIEQSKQFDEKRQQNLAKRDEIEAKKKARAQEKLRRTLSTTKPDLVSETVKRYETKRSEVLERIQKKEQEKKTKLDKALNREKPNCSSLVSKKYDEKRAGVLERIQKKQEETKLKYEQKINKKVPDKSAMIPDIAKSYDNRRAEVLERLKQSEDEKKMKIEKKLERVENAHQRYKENMLFIREKSAMGRTFDFDDIKEGSGESSDDDDQDSGISLHKSYQQGN